MDQAFLVTVTDESRFVCALPQHTHDKTKRLSILPWWEVKKYLTLRSLTQISKLSNNIAQSTEIIEYAEYIFAEW